MKQRGLVILAAALLLGAGVVWLVTRPAAEAKVVSRKQTAERPAPAVPVPPPATDAAKPIATAPMPQDGAPVRPATAAPGPGREAIAPAITPAKSEITSLTNVPSRSPAAPGTPPAPPPTVDDVTAASIQLDQVSLMLRDYRTIAGANPVGTNAEIMKSLMGGNPKGAMLGPPEGQSLNAQGELLDRWGTPIFFHQLSATSMEIRSAGQDKTMGTADDVVHR